MCRRRTSYKIVKSNFGDTIFTCCAILKNHFKTAGFFVVDNFKQIKLSKSDKGYPNYLQTKKKENRIKMLIVTLGRNL